MEQGFNRFIFSLGYMSDVIIRHIQNSFPQLNVVFVLEDEPLGTGGAIHLSLQQAKQQDVFILNGDTLFNIDFDAFLQFHQSNPSECSLALKPMKQIERYGVLELNAQGRIVSFQEKKYYDAALINGGIYIVSKDRFLQQEFSAKFSFEKDYLERFHTEKPFYGMIQDAYFIDIGIPEDYLRAQEELREG